MEELEHIGLVECRRNDRRIIKGALVTLTGIEAWSGVVHAKDINAIAELAQIKQAIEFLEEAVADRSASKKSAITPAKITWALHTILKGNGVVQIIRQYLGL